MLFRCDRLAYHLGLEHGFSKEYMSYLETKLKQYEH